MPQVKQPNRLGKICLNNIINNMNSHWFKRNDLRLQLIANPPKYILGPFECLNDENVDYILKRLHDDRLLVRFHLYFLLHNVLKRLDLSVIKKRTFINPDIANHIGSTCIVSQNVRPSFILYFARSSFNAFVEIDRVEFVRSDRNSTEIPVSHDWTDEELENS